MMIIAFVIAITDQLPPQPKLPLNHVQGGVTFFAGWWKGRLGKLWGYTIQLGGTNLLCWLVPTTVSSERDHATVMEMGENWFQRWAELESQIGLVSWI